MASPLLHMQSCIDFLGLCQMIHISHVVIVYNNCIYIYIYINIGASYGKCNSLNLLAPDSTVRNQNCAIGKKIILACRPELQE